MTPSAAPSMSICVTVTQSNIIQKEKSMELLKSANVPIHLLITLARTVLSHRTSLSSSDLMFAESNTSSEVGGRLIDNDAEDEVVNGDPLRLFVRAGVRKNPPEDPEGPGKTPFWAFLSSEESRFLLLV